MMKTVNILGAGRLGSAIALALKPYARIQAFNTRQLAVQDLSQIEPAELNFITTPDAHIEGLAMALAEQVSVNGSQAYVHCSGLLSSQILVRLKLKGCLVGSFHPFRPFSTSMSQDAFQGCYCFAEGDASLIYTLTALFSKCGAIVTSIAPEQKPYIHLAAVVASNHLVTLASLAGHLLSSTSLSSTQQQDMLLDIMECTITNLRQAPSFSEALTGPIVRGDTQTIQAHVDCLTDKNAYHVYRQLSLYLLRQITLPESVRREMEKVLDAISR